MIIAPKKIYFDFAIWVEFAEGRKGDRAFFALVDRSAVVPVLSFIHLLEMNVAEGGDPLRQPGLVVARYFDRLLGPRRNKLLWGVAYADVAFIDKNVVDARRRGRLPRTRLPKRIGEFGTWLEEECIGETHSRGM